MICVLLHFLVFCTQLTFQIGPWKYDGENKVHSGIWLWTQGFQAVLIPTYWILLWFIAKREWNANDLSACEFELEVGENHHRYSNTTYEPTLSGKDEIKIKSIADDIANL